MGTVHARNARRLEGAELVAVASTRPERGAEVGRELGVRHRTYEQLFAADDIDAVVIAARSVDHGPLALDVLHAGKHLFVEKPGAATLAEHEALRDAAAARAEQVVQIGYMRRYDSRFVEAAGRVQRGEAGTPLVVLLTSRDTEWPEGEDPRETGGFLLDMASHDYDTACWVFGDEPVEVAALRQAHVYSHLAPLGDLDNGIVTIRFAGGGIAVTHVSRTSPVGHDIRCEVVGTHGSVFVENPAPLPPDYRERFAEAYVRELQAFVEACRDGAQGPTLEDDRKAVAIGVAARASAVAGHPLAVGADWPWP
jgi:predicted dehydrogenase